MKGLKRESRDVYGTDSLMMMIIIAMVEGAMVIYIKGYI